MRENAQCGSQGVRVAMKPELEKWNEHSEEQQWCRDSETGTASKLKKSYAPKIRHTDIHGEMEEGIKWKQPASMRFKEICQPELGLPILSKFQAFIAYSHVLYSTQQPLIICPTMSWSSLAASTHIAALIHILYTILYSDSDSWVCQMPGAYG
jgi:hypothetical protein